MVERKLPNKQQEIVSKIQQFATLTAIGGDGAMYNSTSFLNGARTAGQENRGGMFGTNNYSDSDGGAVGAAPTARKSGVSYSLCNTSEFIEFTNAGSTTIKMDGYNFSQGVTHTFGVEDSITAGQYFVIAYDLSAFRNRYGIDADAIWNSGGLSNGGENITMMDDFGRAIDSVDFDYSTPWPASAGQIAPDGNGSSIELQTGLTADNNDGINWITSALAVPGAVVNGFQVFGSPINPYTTGISAVAFEEKTIKVFPNPTRGIITIETTTSLTQRIQLISIDGTVLRDLQSEKNQIQLDLSALANGVYFLKVGTKTQKVILSRQNHLEL